MARITVTEERTFCVTAPIEQVYSFFAAPDQHGELRESLESHELLGKDRVRWVFQEKKKQGLRFQADYTVIYEGNGVDHVHWRFLEGNAGNEGDVWLTPAHDGGTEIHYCELIEPDLPIPSAMARLIEPMVRRELREEIGHFLDRVRDRFGAA